MAESEEEYDEFEEQLRMEKAEKERRSRCSNIVHGQTRTDPDGTVYEWDADKMAYFPKVRVFVLRRGEYLFTATAKMRCQFVWWKTP